MSQYSYNLVSFSSLNIQVHSQAKEKIKNEIVNTQANHDLIKNRNHLIINNISRRREEDSYRKRGKKRNRFSQNNSISR